MKQLFILGRNPILSKAEIIGFLKARKGEFKEIFHKGNLYLLETKDKIDIQKLGGTIKSGIIEFEGNEKEFQKFMESNELIEDDKFTYEVIGNLDLEIIKEKFKKEKKKAMLKHGRKKLRVQEGEYQSIPSAEYELFLYEESKKIYFGKVDQTFDYEGVKKRDMKKPVRREELAISPRLSKILINLSETKENQNLLDPFCGIGSIIIEALILGVNAYGIDKDQKAIVDARKNLEWFQENYNTRNRYTLKNLDSAQAPDFQFDGVATETPLGKLLNKKLSKTETEKIISDFKKTVAPVLSRIKKIKKPQAKIAITFPVINQARVDPKEIEKTCGLRLISGPFREFREKQFVSRDILVFE